MHFIGGSDCILIVLTLLSLQDVSAALHHCHYHHHPRHTNRVHYLGETTTVAPCPRVLLTHFPHICFSNSLQDTHPPFVIFMLFLNAILCHFHVIPFATRDAFIIPATLSPNGYLCCTTPEGGRNRFDGLNRCQRNCYCAWVAGLSFWSAGVKKCHFLLSPNKGSFIKDSLYSAACTVVLYKVQMLCGFCRSNGQRVM